MLITKKIICNHCKGKFILIHGEVSDIRPVRLFIDCPLCKRPMKPLVITMSNQKSIYNDSLVFKKVKGQLRKLKPYNYRLENVNIIYNDEK